MNRIMVAIVFLFSFGYASSAVAQDYGVVMDVSGNVELSAKGKKTALDLGKGIAVGDSISLKEKGRLSLVGYKGCEQWEFTGPATVRITGKNPEAEKGSKGKVVMARKLPVCYKPGDVKASGSHEQGGLVLMANPTPVEEDMSGPTPSEMSESAPAQDNGQIEQMRKDFKDGKADNAALVTLVMHDLKMHDQEGARPYFMELKKRAPNSELVKNLEKDFDM